MQFTGNTASFLFLGLYHPRGQSFGPCTRGVYLSVQPRIIYRGGGSRRDGTNEGEFLLGEKARGLERTQVQHTHRLALGNQWHFHDTADVLRPCLGPLLLGDVRGSPQIGLVNRLTGIQGTARIGVLIPRAPFPYPSHLMRGDIVVLRPNLKCLRGGVVGREGHAGQVELLLYHVQHAVQYLVQIQRAREQLSRLDQGLQFPVASLQRLLHTPEVCHINTDADKCRHVPGLIPDVGVGPGDPTLVAIPGEQRNFVVTGRHVGPQPLGEGLLHTWDEPFGDQKLPHHAANRFSCGVAREFLARPVEQGDTSIGIQHHD